MLLIVLAEAALRWNFIFWSYCVVIFRVGVDVLYRRATRTSCILPVKSFSRPRVLYTNLTSISLINYCYILHLCKMGKKSDLSPECQKFVKKLFAFYSKEKATKKPIVTFDRLYQKTSKALGVSYTSVHRIMNGKRPCKSNRPKERADDFDHCIIKRTIHGLYSRKIAPTVSIIHKEIKDSIKISKSKLTLTLIDLGYTYKKIGDNRRVLYDQVFIINYRCNYLRKITSFREAGYDIVYMDETWVNQNYCTDYMWLPNDGSDAPKIPSGKGKRLIVLHAGTRSEDWRLRFSVSGQIKGWWPSPGDE